MFKQFGNYNTNYSELRGVNKINNPIEIIKRYPDDYDVIIKLSFENHTYLNSFIEQHTFEKKYEPKFLVLEFDFKGEIEFLSEYQGAEQKSRKCVAEYIQ